MYNRYRIGVLSRGPCKITHKSHLVRVKQALIYTYILIASLFVYTGGDQVTAISGIQPNPTHIKTLENPYKNSIKTLERIKNNALGVGEV